MSIAGSKGLDQEPAKPPSLVIQLNYAGNKLHPTQKPVSILKPPAEAYSVENGVVLDPFGGSGSTGVAAMRTGRNFILIEQDRSNYEIAKERLRALREG